ncbi:nuclear transport factor 2 family protein [Geothrix sp. PMB-07]|uniref:nuclear transport factor 2 family protein n=1 Tax=Geothrix sp. PMB-07 TaxID=3068640 RepID=UPI0027424465|nr:nuclear transport factor 2 family protein [Geothrix sp. PMB-07]WLT32027.1 nuclear transport factor 2 family protein [Geothrix sp. PMB-07]
MKTPARLLILPPALLLAACHPGPVAQPGTQPVPSTATTDPGIDAADAKAVRGFLEAYGRKDLDGMMGYLDEDAVFRGSGTPLTKPQIRDFFRVSFQKHANLRVEAEPLKQVQGTLRTRVKVQTEAIWTDTWIFEMKNHKIHAYSLASGKR